MGKANAPRTNPAIKQGSVFHVPDVPPLDGGKPKGRWVVVLDTNDDLRAGADPVVIVCCSTSVTEAEADRVPLPNRATTPNCRTGLPDVCWAVPRWRFLAPRAKLTDYRGYLSGRALAAVLHAYLSRAAVEPPPPTL